MSDKDNILNMFNKLGHDIKDIGDSEIIDWDLCVNYEFDGDCKLINAYMI